jgi:tyrosinase
MGDPMTSANDPLFFMHHSGLDRLWAAWQDQERKNRLWDVEGKVSGFMGGAQQKDLTLDTPIWMGLSAPDRPVRDVMDVLNENGKGFLCYKYEQ